MASRLQRQVADVAIRQPAGLLAGLRQGDDTVGRDTVKERVIQTAIAEPFLTVEEIARRVGTSAPYVRTTLSVAGLSLSDLRRRTAKELADRLEARARTESAATTEAAVTAVATESTALPATASVTATALTASPATPRVELRPEPAAAAILGVPARQPLVALTYSWPTAGGRGHLGEILTTAPLELAELSGLILAMASSEARSWRPLAPTVIRRVQKRSRARLDATSACEVYLHEVGLAAQIDPDGQELGSGWLQLICVTEADGKPIAVERVAFDGARYTCRLSPSGSSSADRATPELALR